MARTNQPDNIGEVNHGNFPGLQRPKGQGDLLLVGVFSRTGQKLMPTDRFRAVRLMLKSGEARIYSRRPFAIQLTYDSPEKTQETELCCDIGAQHLGVSVKTAKRELLSAQFDMLPDEKQRHDDRRMYRRTRRNRLRYRKPRFDHRVRKENWLAPSVQHKLDAQLDVVRRLVGVLPITKITVEVGKFDPALMSALERGVPPPQDAGYQHGPLYFSDSLRAAVFERDRYTCQICGASPFDGKKGKSAVHLHTHHALFWKGRHGNTLGELLTVCSDCHTARNHRQGGMLWGLTPKVPRLEGATFMNQIRRRFVNELRASFGSGVPVCVTYGAETARRRKSLGIEKSHVNDAYCMGDFQPPARAEKEVYEKKRRNNRILQAFYDAKIKEIRTGKTVPGAALSCGRTNRRDSRRSLKNQRLFRGEKVSKGYNRIRRTHYSIRSGDTICWKGRIFKAGSIHNKGKTVDFPKPILGRKSTSPNKVRVISHVGGWKKLTD